MDKRRLAFRVRCIARTELFVYTLGHRANAEKTQRGAGYPGRRYSTPTLHRIASWVY
jgi:hypothetical protein